MHYIMVCSPGYPGSFHQTITVTYTSPVTRTLSTGWLDRGQSPNASVWAQAPPPLLSGCVGFIRALSPQTLASCTVMWDFPCLLCPEFSLLSCCGLNLSTAEAQCLEVVLLNPNSMLPSCCALKLTRQPEHMRPTCTFCMIPEAGTRTYGPRAHSVSTATQPKLVAPTPK